MLIKSFQHPVVGEITVDCDSMSLADRDQYLVLYSADAGSDAADALAFLDVVASEDLGADKAR